MTRVVLVGLLTPDKPVTYPPKRGAASGRIRCVTALVVDSRRTKTTDIGTAPRLELLDWLYQIGALAAGGLKVRTLTIFIPYLLE